MHSRCRRAAGAGAGATRTSAAHRTGRSFLRETVERTGVATRMLRRIVDIVAISAAAGVCGVLAWRGYEHFESRGTIRAVSGELRRFEQALALQATSGQTQTNARGWPVTIEAEWFNGDPPRNVLVTQARPWIEVAPLEHAELTNPVIRMTIDNTIAAFWYNPYQGIVRARVPMHISDGGSLSLYNAVNGTSLASIHGEPVLPKAVERAMDDAGSGDEPAQGDEDPLYEENTGDDDGEEDLITPPAPVHGDRAAVEPG